MAGLETPANCGPLLKDAYWMERIGFTAEQVEAGPVQEENLIDPESLNNHLARFREVDLEADFLRHLAVSRQKRWLRSGAYAVDGHDILIPRGEEYEGAAATGEGSYGTKRLVLLNVQQNCELVVGDNIGEPAGKRDHEAAPATQQAAGFRSSPLWQGGQSVYPCPRNAQTQASGWKPRPFSEHP